MATESRQWLQIWTLVIPVLLAAAAGRMILNAARVENFPSASLPTSQQLDSLRGFAVRRPEAVPAASAPMVTAYAFGSAEPFSRVTRGEVARYSIEPGQIPTARSRSEPWIVSTIMITEARRVAVVNGLLVSVGSGLTGGAHVAGIEPDYVVIAEAGGRRREVPVRGGAN